MTNNKLNNIIGYIARDKNNTLAFYTEKPNLKDGVWDVIEGYYTLLDNTLFPDLEPEAYKTVTGIKFLED